MKLAVLIPTLGGGGAERVALRLVAGFVRHGHSVDLVIADRRGVLDKEVSPEVQVVNLRAARVARGLLPLARYLRKARPDAVLSFASHLTVVAYFAILIARHRGRFIASERSTLSFVSREELSLRGLVARALTPLAYVVSEAVIAPSEGVAADLRRLGVREVHVIGNPVLDDTFPDRANQEVDDPWLHDRAVPLIVTAGRLTPVKDHETLLRAVAAVQHAQPVRLLILGEGEARVALEKLRDTLGLQGVVQMPGFVKNPLPYMRAADAYVLSSRREGLPNALIEALAMGTRVVATDCESGPREILESGRYGKLVPVGDVQAMAQAIEAVLAEPRPQVFDAWKRRYSADVVIGRYLDILQGESTARIRHHACSAPY